MRLIGVHTCWMSAAAGMGVLLTMAGCEAFGDGRSELERAYLEQKERIAQLEQEIVNQQDNIRVLQNQIAELRDTPGDPVETLIAPVRIELERMSGGYDADGEPGDDGIVLYLQPHDRDGDVIKTAGSLKVVLYDLANPPDRNMIQDYYFDEPTMRNLWQGRLWTNHFTVRCPWPPTGPPEHDQVTADVVFTDRLTGQVLRVQQVFEVQLPGEVPTTQKTVSGQ